MSVTQKSATISIETSYGVLEVYCNYELYHEGGEDESLWSLEAETAVDDYGEDIFFNGTLTKELEDEIMKLLRQRLDKSYKPDVDNQE